MEKIKLNICSIGDPTDPKTWSGTPYNLYSELKKNGNLGRAFDSNASNSKIEKLIPRILSKIFYSTSKDRERGFIYRSLNAARVTRETSRSITNLTLHTGTFDLPFVTLPRNQKHYLYCDSTWSLWSSHSTGMDGYSEKMLADAEKLEKKAYGQMEHIFPVSDYVKRNLINHYRINPEKITVVGTGLGIIKPYFGEKNYAKRKILFAAKGRFEDKGGHLVLKAFEILSESNPDIELLIVGQNEYTDTITVQNVTTHGFISIDELQTIFNECTLFLMPALNEPWGLVYLEALACKMPIVGLNRNSFPEISDYGKHGVGLDSVDPEKLALLLTDMLKDQDRLKKMGQQAQAYCLEKYSWENTVSTILQTIERITK